MALEVFIEEHWMLVERVVAGYLRRVGPHGGLDAVASAKEDLVQGFWERVLRDRRKLLRSYDRRRGSMEAFIRMKVRSYLTDRRRRKVLRVVSTYDELHVPENTARAPDFEHRYMASDTLDKIMRPDAKLLTPQERAVLEAYHGEGLDVVQIAGRLDTTPTAVYETLRRSRRRLNKRLPRGEDWPN